MTKIMKLPLNFNEGRAATLSSPAEVAAQRLRVLVMTILGERVMRPTYGSNANFMVFEPDDEISQAELLNGIKVAIDTWEPGIDVQDIIPVHTRVDDGIVGLEILFTVDEPSATGLLYRAVLDIGGTVSVELIR